MIRVRQAVVAAVLEEADGIQVLSVQCGDQEAKAVCYPALTGSADCGDLVTLNTTAVALALGTGGLHFVMSVWGKERDGAGPGHIMKARYTPSQVCVLAVEEEAGPHHAAMCEPCELQGMPVAVATLHSLIAPFAACYKSRAPHGRLAYIMTDGAALPAAFSRLLTRLRRLQLIDVCITCGHAYGGDLEAVTVYSALQAAKCVARCDACIVAMGPGVVGTGTPLGTTALEQAFLLDAAGVLGAWTLAVPRLSFADPRIRHHGLSHHTATALGLTHRRTTIVLPEVDDNSRGLLDIQLKTANICDRHDIYWQAADDCDAVMRDLGLEVTSMGRAPAQDPYFFAAGGAAGYVAADRQD